MKKFNMRL